MWFIFPQLRGLGHSEMAIRFAISSLDEAEAYLKHQVLGSRLRECTRLVMLVQGRSTNQIFGYPDDLKFRSSMTLFATVASKIRFSRMPYESALPAIDLATLSDLSV